MKTLFIALFGLCLSFQANAVLVEYDFVGERSTENFDASGYVRFDSSNLVSGVNLVSSFVDWELRWGSPNESYVVNAANNALVSDSRFFLDAALNLLPSVRLCSIPCNENQHLVRPAFGVLNGSVWIASINSPSTPFTGMGDFTAGFSIAWTGPTTVTAAVSEPVGMMLLGSILLAVFRVRRLR